MHSLVGLVQPRAELRLGVLHVLRGVAVHRLRVGAHREEAVIAAIGITRRRRTLLPHIGCTAAERLRLAWLTGRGLRSYADHRLATGNGHRNARLVLSAQLGMLLLLLLEIAHGM